MRRSMQTVSDWIAWTVDPGAQQIVKQTITAIIV